MKFGRGDAPKSTPVALPNQGQTVMLVAGAGSKLPARVLESTPDTVLVAIMVAGETLAASELDGLVVEFTDSHGRVRLTGAASLDDPADPTILRLNHPLSVEVLQQREYVRINSARPVVVYGPPDQVPVQSYTVDLSGGGFLLAGPGSLRIGDEVQFQLIVTRDVLMISGTGKVVRVDSSGRLGVQFESITEVDRRRLIRFIFECQRTERQRGLELDGHNGG
jgi:PilZ domain-containing protein